MCYFAILWFQYFTTSLYVTYYFLTVGCKGKLFLSTHLFCQNLISYLMEMLSIEIISHSKIIQFSSLLILIIMYLFVIQESNTVCPEFLLIESRLSTLVMASVTLSHIYLNLVERCTLLYDSFIFINRDIQLLCLFHSKLKEISSTKI